VRTEAIVWLLALAGAPPVPSPSPPSRRAVMAGAWGGEHARLQVAPEETRLELDCAHALIPGPLAVDPSGRVDSSGSLIRQGGGPGPETDAGAGEPARFRGTLSGKTLTLTVTLVGPAKDLGTFKLTHGRPARLSRCPDGRA
jgi:hypothetical protein